MREATIAGATREEGLKQLTLLDPACVAGLTGRRLTNEVLDGVNATRGRETGAPRARAIAMATVVRRRIATEVTPSGRGAGPTTRAGASWRTHASASPRLR